MKIKLKTSCYVIGYGPIRIDEVVEIDSKIGNSLLDSNLAVLIEKDTIEEVKDEIKEVAEEEVKDEIKEVAEVVEEEVKPKATRRRKTSEK